MKIPVYFRLIERILLDTPRLRGRPHYPSQPRLLHQQPLRQPVQDIHDHLILLPEDTRHVIVGIVVEREAKGP